MNSKEVLKSYIERHVYDNRSINELAILDTDLSSWWIFNFKSTFFNRDISEKVAFLFWEEVKKNLPVNEKKISIGGLESGAIPLISALTLYSPKDLSVTGFFIRKSRKKADLANQIEGTIEKDSFIIIVDDILNRGNSLEKIMTILGKDNNKISIYFSVIRYRNLDYYKEKNFNHILLLSLFELNDFTPSLGLKNLEFINNKSKSTLSFDSIWAKKLSKHNAYYVAPKSSPLFYKDVLFLGTDSGGFFAINSKDGSIKWSYSIPFGMEGKRILSSPSLFNNMVIFGAYDGNLYALNIETGKKEWIFFEGDWVGSSPCIAQDLGLVYVGLEFGLFKKKGGLAAVDIKTGKQKWSYYEMDGLTHASPIYSKKFNVVICGCNNKKIYCFNAKNGKLIWVFEAGGEIKHGAVLDEKRGVVYMPSIDGNIYGVLLSDGSLFIKYSALFGFCSTPVIHNDILIIGSLDKNIYAWDLKKQELLWKFETIGRIFASPAIDNDILYIGSNDGRLRAIDPISGKLLGQIILTERIVTKVTINNNVLYVLTDTCELFAFNIKKSI